MRLYQVLSLLILMMISTTLAVIAGAMIHFSHGPWVALAVVIITSIFILFTIESLALSVLRAHAIAPATAMGQKIKNIALKVGVEKVELFESERFSRNIYCFMGLRRHAFLVVGKELAQFITEPEIDALIYCAMARVKNGEARFQTLALALSTLFYLPFLLAPTPSKGKMARVIRSLLLYYHAPFEMLRLWLMRNDKHLLQIDQEIAERFSIQEEMASAFFKMGHVPSAEQKNLSEKVIDSFAVADTLCTELFPQILNFGIKMEDRYKALRQIE